MFCPELLETRVKECYKLGYFFNYFFFNYSSLYLVSNKYKQQTNAKSNFKKHMEINYLRQ